MRIPAALCALFLLVGCLGGPLGPSGATSTPTTATPTDTPTASATPVVETPRPTPAPPADPTPARVADFARSHERAAVHNTVVDDPVVDVSLSCEAAFDRETGDAAYALAACRGSVEERRGGGVAIEDVSADAAVYRVADGADVGRATVADRRPVEAFRGGNGSAVSPRDVRVANFGDENRTVAVTVAVVEGDRVLRRELTVPPGGVTTLRGVVARTGTYVVRVHVGYRTVQRHWVVTTPGETLQRDSGSFGVYVGPDGELSLAPTPRLRA